MIRAYKNQKITQSLACFAALAHHWIQTANKAEFWFMSIQFHRKGFWLCGYGGMTPGWTKDCAGWGYRPTVAGEPVDGFGHIAPGASWTGSNGAPTAAGCCGVAEKPDVGIWLIGTRRLCSSCCARVANRLLAGDWVRVVVVIANGFMIAANRISR